MFCVSSHQVSAYREHVTEGQRERSFGLAECEDDLLESDDDADITAAGAAPADGNGGGDGAAAAAPLPPVPVITSPSAVSNILFGRGLVEAVRKHMKWLLVTWPILHTQHKQLCGIANSTGGDVPDCLQTNR